MHVNNIKNLGGFTPIIDETGKITGYKTSVGGADTVFPFSSGKAHSVRAEMIVNDKGGALKATATLHLDGKAFSTCGNSTSWINDNRTYSTLVVAMTEAEEHEVYLTLTLNAIGDGCKVSAKLYIDNVAVQTIGTPNSFTDKTQTWTSTKYNLNKAYWGS